MAGLRHLIVSVYKMKFVRVVKILCAYMYFFYLIFFFEELKLLTLSYRSVFYFKHQYGVIVGILLYIGSVCYICKECKHC